MAAMTMPHVDDDLYLYMHEIIEEEFPKALRQAFKTLWDQKYALRYGPFDSACHQFGRFHALNSNTFRWLFPNQVSSDFKLPSNPVSSISFEDLDLDELQNIITDEILRGWSPYVPFHNPWDFPSRIRRNPEIPDVDESLFATAIHQLRAIKEQHVYSKGIMNPQLLKRQLAQARGIFAAFNVTLNDSRNTFDFSEAKGLQDLISETTTVNPRNEVVTEKQVADVSGEVGTWWRQLAPRLKIAESKIHNIDEENKGSWHKAHALLIVWKQKEGMNATVGHLADALEEIGRRSIAEKLLGSGFEAPESQFSYFEMLGYVGAFSSEQVRRALNIWVKGKYLGGGTFGKVFRLTHRESGIKVAMKEVKMETQCSESLEGVKQLKNELDKLRRLRHPRIVHVYGLEQNGDFIYLFLDFMAGGSLRDFIKQRGKLDEQLTRKFTRQILEGVDYLHDNEVTHRDIKGPNILLDSDRSVKLADFGVSKKIQKIGTKTDLKSFVGTAFWMAPEILRGEGYGRKVDIWSVGCTVVEMLTGDPPLKKLEPHAAMFRIGNKPLEVEEELPGSTEEARDFVRAAVTWNPTERPNCKELLTHSFVQVTEEELT